MYTFYIFCIASWSLPFTKARQRRAQERRTCCPHAKLAWSAHSKNKVMVTSLWSKPDTWELIVILTGLLESELHGRSIRLFFPALTQQFFTLFFSPILVQLDLRLPIDPQEARAQCVVKPKKEIPVIISKKQAVHFLCCLRRWFWGRACWGSGFLRHSSICWFSAALRKFRYRRVWNCLCRSILSVGTK